MSIVLATLSIVLGIVSLKWYVAVLTSAYIMETHGIKPDKDEIKSAATFVIKRLFKIR